MGCCASSRRSPYFPDFESRDILQSFEGRAIQGLQFTRPRTFWTRRQWLIFSRDWLGTILKAPAQPFRRRLMRQKSPTIETAARCRERNNWQASRRGQEAELLQWKGASEKIRWPCGKATTKHSDPNGRSMPKFVATS